jgi:hypothetical protein
VIVLGGHSAGSVASIASVSPEFVSRIQAGKTIQAIAPIVGGKGGGKPDNARGGGKDPSKIDEALGEGPLPAGLNPNDPDEAVFNHRWTPIDTDKNARNGTIHKSPEGKNRRLVSSRCRPRICVNSVFICGFNGRFHGSTPDRFRADRAIAMSKLEKANFLLRVRPMLMKLSSSPWAGTPWTFGMLRQVLAVMAALLRIRIGDGANPAVHRGL